MDQSIILSDVNTVINPNFHDGYFIGFFLIEKSAFLLIKDLSNNIICFYLRNITDLKINDFMEGNIIRYGNIFSSRNG